MVFIHLARARTLRVIVEGCSLMLLRGGDPGQCYCGPVKAGALGAVGRQKNHLIHLTCEGSNLTLLSEQHAFLAWALLVVRVHPCARRPMTLLAAGDWSVRASLVSVVYKAPSFLQSSLHSKATEAGAVMPATCVTQNYQNPALHGRCPGPGEGRGFASQ